MQLEEEVGKWVTDGKHTYPYTAYLDELLANGKLKFCDKPLPVAPGVSPRLVAPTQLSPEERGALSERLGVSVNDLLNMSAQELAEAEAEQDAGKMVQGFPT
jgi:hypothetical protein